jgi:excisionase family DNA binding protein
MYLTLEEAAAQLRLCTKTLAKFLKANPRQPALYARVGRHYLIAASDLDRMCGGVSVQ